MTIYVSKYHIGSEDPSKYIVEDDDTYFSYDYPLLVAYADVDVKMIADFISAGLFVCSKYTPPSIKNIFAYCLE